MPVFYTLAAAVILAASEAAAQGRVTLRVDFAENAATSESAITSAFITKAWTDSVNIFFNAELAQRGPANLVRVAQPRDFTDYRLLVQALPLMAGEDPSGITAYSLIVFRAPSLGNAWQYLTSSVGYTRSARTAASDMLRTTVSAIARR